MGPAKAPSTHASAERYGAGAARSDKPANDPIFSSPDDGYGPSVTGTGFAATAAEPVGVEIGKAFLSDHTDN